MDFLAQLAAAQRRFPAAPLVLAVVLGSLFERSLQKTLQVSGADPMIFIQSPISATLLAVGLFIMVTPIIKWAWMRVNGGARATAQ